MVITNYKIGMKYWEVENESEGNIGNRFFSKVDAVNMAKKMRKDDRETGLDFLGKYHVLEKTIVGKKGNAWMEEEKIVYITR